MNIEAANTSGMLDENQSKWLALSGRDSEQLVQNYNSSVANNSKIAEGAPIQQLKNVINIFNGSLFALDNGQVDDRVIQKLQAIQEDEGTVPLTRLVAKDLLEKIYTDTDIEGEDSFDSLNDIGEEECAWDEFKDVAYEILGRETDFATIYKIAPGTMGLLPDSGDWIDDYNLGVHFGLIANADEVFYNKNATQDQKLDEENVFLLSVAHNPVFRPLIEDKLKLKLQDISLPAQIQLLKYMTKVGDERFEKLCNGLNRVEPDVRLKLAEGFLAADFGEDFGDALISIAKSEQLTNKQIGEILNNIDSCRKSIKEITGLYQNFDNGDFAKEYERSSNERLTDALMAFKEIAEKGVAEADLDWAGQPKFDYNSAMEALKYEARSLEIISGTLGDVNSGEKGAFAEVVMHPDPLDQRLRRTIYNFYSPSHGYVLLYTRPEGSHSFDPMVEYGKMRSRYDTTSSNVGVEASISLITNPVDPFSLPSPFKPDFKATKNPQFYDISTMNKVSAIRLDREGRAPGMPADDPNRDPINLVGMVSVDLAAIGDREDTPSGKIARLLSTGGKLREAASNVDSSLNHNTKWFDQNRYGTSSGFKSLVNYVDTMAKQWCNEHTPENSAQSFTRLMKQARGRKARGQVA